MSDISHPLYPHALPAATYDRLLVDVLRMVPTVGEKGDKGDPGVGGGGSILDVTVAPNGDLEFVLPSAQWGIGAQGVYYDPDNITPGEEAVMILDEGGHLAWVLLTEVG